MNESSYQAKPKRMAQEKQSQVNIHAVARNHRINSKRNADESHRYV